MAGNSDRRSLLRPEESDLSEASTAIASPPPEPAPTFNRRAYHRMASGDSIDNSLGYQLPPLSSSPPFGEKGVEGLGLSSLPTKTSSSVSIPRKPLASCIAPSPPTPSTHFFMTPTETHSPSSASSSKTPLSPPWQRFEPQYSRRQGLRPVTEADEESLDKRRQDELLDTPEFGEDQPFTSVPMNDGYDNGARLLDGCPSSANILSKRSSRFPMSIIMLSIYSTIFSGIWLVLALVQPRFGRRIRSSGGSLNISTASTIFAFFAKTIELSFVTIFVTFVGQVLSRRSLMKNERGITIAEMNMRSWVIQPGSMITQWPNLRHAGISKIGSFALTAAFVAMFYTTASDALVVPHLKFGKLQPQSMYGPVKMEYANSIQIAATCQTPISTKMDPVDSGSTCLQVSYAGQSYHNAIVFLETWAKISRDIGTSFVLEERPAPQAMLYDNTTVTGSWTYTNTSNVTAAYAKYGRVINNITMSMPHAGIVQAAKHPKNAILQPDDLDGIGQYRLEAAVFSPSVNVLCANAKADELAPLVYATWPNSNISGRLLTPTDDITAPHNWDNEVQVVPGSPFFNSTVLDDIFEWGEKYSRKPPAFPLYPAQYNSVTNATMPWGADAYLLIKAPNETTTNYTICQLRSLIDPDCSTIYNVTGSSSAHLHSKCVNPEINKMAYARSVTNSTVTRAGNWKDVASEWMNSLSLGTGIKNANSSNTRLLSYLVLAEPKENLASSIALNPLMPSIAEQLAILSGNTLLMSTTDSTFRHYWPYANKALPDGILMEFNATIISQQYASGFTTGWQASFYLILFLVFATNVFCLVYFLVYSGFVTDFTEQQNLFALAINSPPARSLAGSCGAGPEREQMKINWRVVEDNNSGHFYMQDAGREIEAEAFDLRQRKRQILKSPSSYTILSNKRGSWL
ncbi:hypothetical protein BJ875DRAFT_381946 [Amylocarpus encephaloides]|uniref:Mcm2 3 5 family protein n=1 Tax=Amylocarpus encephaloides TaxID=45428 RepID=A0A9P7YF07_9HELO|nr:hypothetical protein BJ875DRAFT_381946 [Amylocarpus encephaloides]